MDGKWGGMGMQSWFSKVDKKNPANVYEIAERWDEHTQLYHSYWLRFWDNEAKEWKEPSPKEANMGAKKYLKKRKKVDFASFMSVIVTPQFTKDVSKLNSYNLNLRDILTVQPLCR